jgi:hypothetical protein
MMVDIQLTVAQEGILMRIEVKVGVDTLLRMYTGCRMESRRFQEASSKTFSELAKAFMDEQKANREENR